MASKILDDMFAANMDELKQKKSETLKRSLEIDAELRALEEAEKELGALSSLRQTEEGKRTEALIPTEDKSEKKPEKKPRLDLKDSALKDILTGGDE